MSVSQSFWRELYDHIPGLLLVFRIDENDQAQLVFVNEQVQNELGFTPEQFVLASESQSQVQKELEGLVDEVAELSQLKQTKSSQPVILHDKLGNQRMYDYKYRLFKLKSSRSNFLLIQLEESGSAASVQQAQPAAIPTSETPFVADADLSKAAYDQAYNLAGTDQNLLLRGEPGAGKLTLARKMYEWAGYSANTLLLDYSNNQNPDLNEALRNNEGALIIHHIATMPADDQKQLEAYLKTSPIRIIATSTISLENALEKGRFSQDLYYYLAFQTILIPPLRKRHADIESLVDQWLRPVGKQLGLGEIEIPEEQYRTLMEYNWPENFREFYRVIRYSLLQMKEHSGHFLIHLAMDNATQSSLFENGSDHSLLTFDEMNRQYLQKVLKHTDGKIYGKDGAAAILGLKPTTLQSKLKKLNVR